jgi:hypothetical protein
MPHLPEEVWVEILSYVDPCTLWWSVQHVNKSFRSRTHDLALKKLVPKFKLVCTFPGRRSPRWRDECRFFFQYETINKNEPQYAYYKVLSSVRTSPIVNVSDLLNDLKDPNISCDETWAVCFRRKIGTGGIRKKGIVDCYNGPLDVIVSDVGGVWCDWKGALDTYFRAHKRQPKFIDDDRGF